MSPSYRSFDSAATINGESIGAVLAAFQIPQQARELLERHGLPASPVPGQWYSMQKWLDVLAELEERFGGQTVYQAGLQVIDNSVWPPLLKDLPGALNALQMAYSTNVHGHDMGYYRAETVSAHQIRVFCLTPNPLEFECGIVTGLARRFKPADAVRIRVEKETPAPGSSPHLKQFLVSW